MSGLVALSNSIFERQPVSLQVLLTPANFSPTGYTGAYGTASIPVNLSGNFDVDISAVEWSDGSGINTVLSLNSAVLRAGYGNQPGYLFEVNNTSTYVSIGRKVFTTHACMLNNYIDFSISDPVNKIVANPPNLTQMKYCVITLQLTPSVHYSGVSKIVL